VVQGCLVVALAHLCVGAAAQSDQSKADPARIKRIMSLAEARMSSQSDIWFNDGDYPRAVNLLRYRAALEPSNYDIHTDLGWMLENVERWSEALAVYVRFRKANPDQADAALPEANFYFLKKAYAKVPPLLEDAIKKKPHPNVFRLLANSYERLGLLDDSVRVWDKYLSDHPNDGQAKVNRERVLKKKSGKK
jgi:tetratricopeptide (TPR) repeat protein